MPEPSSSAADGISGGMPANLVYASPDDPGIRRQRAGKGFRYRGPSGAAVDARTLARVRALVIPPAWRDVWICADADGHLQATGRDEKGRRQYRYHDAFRQFRDQAKFEHVLAFAKALPALRQQIARDMHRPGLDRRKVVATVAHLLESTLIRVGNLAYVRENNSFGLTTLRNRHVRIEGADLKFHFKGKSGKVWKLSVHDRRVAGIVRRCQELPGQHLFQYIDETGERQAITSADVNAYLREVSGADITAKDFRTWDGTVMTAMILAGEDRPENDRLIARTVAGAIKVVAARLGNTPAICRQCYVHPGILSAYGEGALVLDTPTAANEAGDGLRPEESAVLAFLERGTQVADNHARRSAAA